VKLLYIHGLEGGPQSKKAVWLSARFPTVTPLMDTSSFEGCVDQQAELIGAERPELVIGSSFGGAVAVTLLERGLWTGPTILLAQAAWKRGHRALPEGRKVWLVHGTRDDLIPFQDSERLAATGTPGLVTLVPVDDDHGLLGICDSGLLETLVKQALG
jgi:hypothetical protein